MMLLGAGVSMTFMNGDGQWYHYAIVPIFVALAVVSFLRVKNDIIEISNGFLWDRKKRISSLSDIKDAKLEWASLKLTLADDRIIKIDVLDVSVDNRDKLLAAIKGHG